MNMLHLNKYVNFTIGNIKLKQHLKPIMVLFVSVIAIELYSLIDVTMLTHTTSSARVGYLSNAVKIVKMIANTFTAMGQFSYQDLVFITLRRIPLNWKKLYIIFLK